LKYLERDVYFVIDQQKRQLQSCEMAKQSILTSATKQLSGNVDAVKVIQGQMGSVQTELSNTKVLLGDAQYATLQLQKDLSKAKTMSKLEKVGYFLGGVVITYFTVKITK
jgi:hypothetical protein